MVSKYDDNQIRHMEMQENANREWVYDAILKILHVSGPINPAHIFTSEVCNGAIFYAYKIPSSVLCLTFFSTLSWMFIFPVGMLCLLQLLCWLFPAGVCIFWH
jgi:hypothetical protein